MAEIPGGKHKREFHTLIITYLHMLAVANKAILATAGMTKYYCSWSFRCGALNQWYEEDTDKCG